MTVLEKLGGRRFLATMIGGAGTFLLCWMGRIDAVSYQWTTIGLIGAYITGNTTQKVRTPAAPAEPSPGA